MPDPLKLRIESKLARAHQLLWAAAREAESMRDQGLCDDLYQIAGEVGRVNTSLIGGQARPPHSLTSRT